MLKFVILFTLFIQCLTHAIANTSSLGATSSIINAQNGKKIQVKALYTADECFQNACSQSTYCSKYGCSGSCSLFQSLHCKKCVSI